MTRVYLTGSSRHKSGLVKGSNPLIDTSPTPGWALSVLRPLRIEYPGAIFHVMGRGDRRETIFKDDQDRQRFLATMDEGAAKTEWQIHAVCLMPNHVHIVLQSGTTGV